ncbi:MAG: hypothetical protein OXN17_16530 [Candidatus Poribacteria bacterium]|nr:hypothetical protein [Candidatus Poribacteria bacterium]MDE0506781.1 hypothetical protein [Candidatus Poribacteria bacterium]
MAEYQINRKREASKCDYEYLLWESANFRVRNSAERLGGRVVERQILLRKVLVSEQDGMQDMADKPDDVELFAPMLI